MSNYRRPRAKLLSIVHTRVHRLKSLQKLQFERQYSNEALHWRKRFHLNVVL